MRGGGLGPTCCVGAGAKNPLTEKRKVSLGRWRHQRPPLSTPPNPQAKEREVKQRQVLPVLSGEDKEDETRAPDTPSNGGLTLEQTVLAKRAAAKLVSGCVAWRRGCEC